MGSELSDSAAFRMMRSRAIDPIASIGSCVFTVACIFKVPEILEMTASDLGIAIGSACMLATTLRAFALRKKG